LLRSSPLLQGDARYCRSAIFFDTFILFSDRSFFSLLFYRVQSVKLYVPAEGLSPPSRT
jgi:hypothetical protein